jgi:hypothetical protein
MFLGLVLLIPPNPEKSLEAVSVYEGLRLERIAQEANPNPSPNPSPSPSPSPNPNPNPNPNLNPKKPEPEPEPEPQAGGGGGGEPQGGEEQPQPAAGAHALGSEQLPKGAHPELRARQGRPALLDKRHRCRLRNGMAACPRWGAVFHQGGGHSPRRPGEPEEAPRRPSHRALRPAPSGWPL